MRKTEDDLTVLYTCNPDCSEEERKFSLSALHNLQQAGVLWKHPSHEAIVISEIPIQ
jgi:hypothetical protein